MRFVAIDLGATFIKSALLDTGSFTISHVKRVPFPPFLKQLPLAHREISPRAVLRKTKEQIDRLLAIAPDCAGIVSCSQMHGLILTDGQGAPLTNFISWMDERALLPHPSRKGSFLDVLLSRLSSQTGSDFGREIKPGSTIALLFWLAATQGVPRNAVPSSLPDFIMARLSNTAITCEPTMASGFGAFDAGHGSWQVDAIERLGLGSVQWPEIVPYRAVRGSYQYGATHIPVFVSVGDQQCALLGSLLQPGDLSINVATGSQVSHLNDRFEPGEYRIRPFFDRMFLNTITHLPAGRALNTLIDLLDEFGRSQRRPLKDPWQYIEHAAASSESTNLRVDLNVFSGLHGNGGGIVNIREYNLTVGQLFRAAFEHMAENYYTAAMKLDPHASWKQLVFSGGLITQSALLRHLITSKFGLPARMSPTQEDALLGLLVLSVALSGQAKTVLEAMEQVRMSGGTRIGGSKNGSRCREAHLAEVS